MKRILLLLLLFSPFLWAFEGTHTEQITASVEIAEGEYTITTIAFDYTGRVATQPNYVIEGNANDLEDGSLVCPNAPIVVEVNMEGKYAFNGDWYATFVAPANECVPEGTTTIADVPFEEYSAHVATYSSTDAPTRISTFYSAPVDTECDLGNGQSTWVTGVYGVKGMVYPEVTINIGGHQQRFTEGTSYSYTNTLGGAGTATVEVEGVIKRVVIARVTPEDADFTYTSYSTYDTPISIFNHVVHLTITQPSVEMEVVETTPGEITNLPTTVEVAIRNNGNVPLLIRQATAEGYTVTPQQGFNVPISPGEVGRVVFTIDGDLVPPEGVDITLEGESDRAYCGDVATGSVVIHMGRGSGNAYPVIRVNGQTYTGAGNEALVNEGMVSVTFSVCSEGGATVNSTREITGAQQVLPRESSIVSVEGCSDIKTRTFTCQEGETYTAFHYISGDSNDEDNTAVVDISCVGVGTCTVEPPQRTFLPGEGGLFTVYCEGLLCNSVNAYALVPWVSLTTQDYTVEARVAEDAPMGGTTSINVMAENNGRAFTCSFQVDVLSGECIDYI